MYSQKILFSKSNSAMPECFCFRNNGESISLETYFNVLDYSLIKNQCGGSQCFITLSYKGEATLFVCSNHIDTGEKILFEDVLSSSTSKSTYTSKKIDLSQLKEKGFLYIKFEKKGFFELIDGAYNVETPNENNNVSLAIVICTYKREQYVTHNVDVLSKNCKDTLSDIFVIDNGGTLDSNYPDKRVHILKNKNYGGSGGFTRGILEAYNNKNTYMMLMDDDIEFDPEIINRAFSLLKNYKEDKKKNWIGFAMFAFDKPTLQYEMGANWNGKLVIPNNHNLDFSSPKDLYLNQYNRDKYQYSAWWSLIMPTSIVDEQRLPLPLFIKMDDVEYGMRASGKVEINFANGFGVWHESFDAKDSTHLKYYVYRNALIVNSIYKIHSGFYVWFRYKGKILLNILKGHKDHAKMYNIAMEHYLKGPSFFYNTNFEDNNASIIKQSKNRTCCFSVLWNALKNNFKIICKYKSVKKQYEADFKRFTSIDYWKEILSIK